MIITCPACSTRYVVPESAIGAEGRTVRCAKCRHSWFQDGPAPQRAPQAEPVSQTPPPPPPPPPIPPADRSPEPRNVQPEPSAPVARTPAPPPPVTVPEPPEPDFEEPPPPLVQPEPRADTLAAEEGLSHFDHEPPFRPRRNTLKLLTYAGVIFAAVAAGLIVAVSYFGLPDWIPVNRPTFAMAQEDLQLEFPADQQERRQLPNGTEFFGASGTITNIGSSARDVPPILIVLRDARDRIVYSWEVYPPKRTLAPGETITINEAVTDVPRAARVAEIGWKPE